MQSNAELTPKQRYYQENKDAIKAKQATYRETTRDKAKERSRKWYRENKDRAVRWRVNKTYGVTLEVLDRLFEEQGYKCAICGSTEPSSKSGWHTDHCHETGKVRGILCQHCNLLLGHAKDNPEVLETAASYLRRHNGTIH